MCGLCRLGVSRPFAFEKSDCNRTDRSIRQIFPGLFCFLRTITTIRNQSIDVSYHVIDPDDCDPLPDRPSETRSIAGAAGLETLGLREYRVAPGEDVPVSGLHYHDEQEEAFYVLNGELAVETPDRTYRVTAGECFIAEPGSPHRAYNEADADKEARVLGIGAPSIDDAHVYEEDA